MSRALYTLINAVLLNSEYTVGKNKILFFHYIHAF